MLRSTDASPSQEVPSRSPAICSCRKHPAPLPLLRRERLHRRGRRCSFLVRRCSRGRGRADNPDPRRLPNEVLPPSAAADQPFFERKCFSQTAETGPRPGRSRAQVPHREPARLGFVNPGALALLPSTCCCLCIKEDSTDHLQACSTSPMQSPQFLNRPSSSPRILGPMIFRPIISACGAHLLPGCAKGRSSASMALMSGLASLRESLGQTALGSVAAPGGH